MCKTWPGGPLVALVELGGGWERRSERVGADLSFVEGFSDHRKTSALPKMGGFEQKNDML
jgi:hypothetical protein